jgi:glycosyltransferase involved in cell wall biosynthesis
MKKGLLVQDHTYSHTIYHKKIMVCGPPFPPPYGGISVHLKSVQERFEKQGNRVYHFDTLVAYRYRLLVVYLFKLAYTLCAIRPDILYYHTLAVSNSAPELQLLVFLKRFLHYTVVLVEHNCLHMLSRPQGFIQKLNRLVPSIDEQILIGHSTYQSYCDVGVAASPIVLVERAFVPPVIERDEPLPPNLARFCAMHAPIITMISTRLVFMDGRDMYGVDTAIDVMHQIQKNFSSLGLICLIGCIDEPVYYSMLCERITAYGLDGAFCMVQGTYSLWPVLKKTDLFLRPTLCDGASVSEDEAHYLGIPVVASDVCVRNKKTVTYSSGSVADCSTKVSEVLAYGYSKK